MGQLGNFFVTICAVFLFQTVYAKFVFNFDLEDNFQQCEEGVPMPAINMSMLQFSELDDASMQVTGRVLFEADYHSPIALRLYSIRKMRGSWVAGEISRSDYDICMKLQIPTEPWYTFTKHFQQKRCPFKKGHEEILPEIPYQDLGFGLPAEFAGEWKIFLEIIMNRNGRKVKECLTIPTTILEV
ncbi:uncharacterized protein LOC120423461 [Culex pipiens pallens]|uniref:uncharacterized protein LOC120423461 n=1 Tax=Culex pipiens pallens TaxID=42434 RepID=UPI001954D45C|nr:uncharacterized protein LOC120423461 [Culex pipiens pallens]